MLTEQNLQDLIAYHPGPFVLSVYLNTDLSINTTDTYKLHLRQMLKGVEAKAAQDINAVKRFIDYEYDWSGQSVAIFSCVVDNFFHAFPLQFPTINQVQWTNNPYVKPLARLFDSYGSYGVALVDKQGARLFHFNLGALREQKSTIGEAVRQTKSGGGSQAAGRRGGAADQTLSAEEVVARNLKDSARFAARFFDENRIRRVIIGGTDTNVSRFRELLPKSWQSLVVGTFPMDMTAGHDQVLEKAIEVIDLAGKDHQAKLIEAVITAAAKGQGGVIRLDDTLGAVHAGQVQTLVISEGYHQPGYRCNGCDYLTTQKLEVCPFCGGNFETIEDAVEMAVQRVLRDGGAVEIVHESAQLEKAGSIGALLRY
jgi:peptide subunit release factor 1 (eRF1)